MRERVWARQGTHVRTLMTLALRPITNRAADGKFRLPADGWWHLVPIGEYEHRESGLSQVLDRETLQGLVNRFTPGILVDFDHFSYDTSRSTEAAGWIDQVELRQDGIWAQARWSDIGEAALLNGRYRFASPVWMPRDVVRLDGNRVRPIRLHSAGLTNQPNLRGMAPLTNRTTTIGDPSVAPAETTPPQTSAPKSMKSVANRLGLQDDASEDAVRTAVDRLITERNTLSDEITPLKNRATTAEAEVERMKGLQADTDFAPYKEALPESAHAHWRTQLIANRDATLATLATLDGRTGATSMDRTKTPVLANRGTGGGSPGQASDPQGAFVRRVNEYRMANRCSYDDAYTAVRIAEPKLFADAVQRAAATT